MDRTGLRHRAGHRRLRAAITVGAPFAVGILLIAAAADGSLLAPGARSTIAPTTAASHAPARQVGHAAPASPTASASPTTGVIPEPPTAEPSPAQCIDPISKGPGLKLPDPGRAALLIGDSQSGGAAGVPAQRTWTQAGLRGAGYDVRFVGAGGTGFVATTSSATNYPSALTQGQWTLPCTDPALIVIQGGGNDATQGATDAQITGGADAVVSTLTRTYPSSVIVMIGTLARGAAAGGGRRTAVDGVLGAYALGHHLAFISAGDWLTRYQASSQLADGVHLTQAGHDHLAGVLGTQLNELQLTQTDLARAQQTRPNAER
ncbi:SGNH/GDSL hydrolase family protein [Arthrobacter burdickii]|uniref:SGNH/GDSL hydrolase family protein n=1 Tax=Arthrobacter burdickii TaxID=3035920 RepID=A0ABT8JWL0_9MICC|nr:SGNH/GDSL hydrolase family protein [Arthrobacter burdickii]MDN4609560.1 SGNH/GDSL hydrolase family protein [Arthrobacter burdickii]